VFEKSSTRILVPFVLSSEFLYIILHFDDEDGEITGEVGVD
jgi:hypothetical protein